MVRLLVLTVAILGFAQGAIAQDDDPPRAFEGTEIVWPEFDDPPPGAPEARLRIVFDPVLQSQTLGVEAGVPFEAYIVAHDIQISLRGWEAKLLIDERLKVIEKDLLADLDLGQGNEIRAAVSDLNKCTEGSPVVLGTLKLVLTEPGAEDLVLGLAPVDRPSYPTVETDLELPTPVYLVCRPDNGIRPFDACKVCAVVNPVSVVPERDESGAPKLDFAPAKGRH